MNKNRMLGIIIALSVAMVGATVVVSYGALQAEAAKSGTSISWCFTISGGALTCYPNHGDCTKAAQEEPFGSSCSKKKNGP